MARTTTSVTSAPGRRRRRRSSRQARATRSSSADAVNRGLVRARRLAIRDARCSSMIRTCTLDALPEMDAIINDAARAYRGHVPDDCLHDPYMPREELIAEIGAGVRFSGWDEDGRLLGVMGIQDVLDVALIRHA